MRQEFKRFVVMSQEILEDPDLTPAEKLLLARYSGFNGEIFESPENTAKMLGISLRNLKTHRLNLEKKGFLICIKNNGRGKTYVVNNCKLTGEVCKNLSSDDKKLHTENKEENKEVTKVTSVAQQPKVASQAPRKKSEFNLTIEKICNILSIDVNKINWAAVGKWYKEGKQNNCTDDDFLLAAQAMAKANKERGVFVSLNKVLTNTSYWLSVAEPVKPKGAWNG